ncbi:MAG: AAA family ATPase [bacterium]|nr:AAA family ATPase [bacterium]
MFILVGGTKGGVGKSTIACNLAVELAREGDTLIIDCDEQQSSLRFTQRRQSDPRVQAVHLSGDIRVQANDLARKYTHTVIDVSGADGSELRSAMLCDIDKMICPVLPGFFDIEAMVILSQIIRDAKVYNSDLNASVVINRAHTNMNVSTTRDAKDFIENNIENVSALNAVLHDRVAYGYGSAAGMSAGEYEKSNRHSSRSGSEVLKLLKEIRHE